jgi:hypothetical protein
MKQTITAVERLSSELYKNDNSSSMKIFEQAQEVIMILILLLLLVAIVFFYLGKYTERIEWNKLIEKGILPKPFKRK